LKAKTDLDRDLTWTFLGRFRHIHGPFKEQPALAFILAVVLPNNRYFQSTASCSLVSQINTTHPSRQFVLDLPDPSEKK
jgi:hypothetical protein